MRQEYEYKFVRLGEGWQLVKREARESYRSVIEEHAAFHRKPEHPPKSLMR